MAPRHHLVPQMYLRRFADDREHLAAVPRDAPDRVVSMVVRKAAAEVGFYAIPTEDLEPHARGAHHPEVAEQALSGLESACSGHIADMLRGGFPPRLEARFQLSAFIGLQYTRGRRFRRDLDDLARMTAPWFLQRELTPERVRDGLVAAGQPAGPDDVADMLARLTGPDGPKPVLRRGHYVQHAFRNGIEEVGASLFVRSWRLLAFTRPCLLTSDEPVAVPTLDSRGPANVPALWFPLDRQHALELSLTGSETVVRPPLAKARKINRIVATQAEQWIFHHPLDTPLADLTIGPRHGLVEEVVEQVGQAGLVGQSRRLARRPLVDPAAQPP